LVSQEEIDNIINIGNGRNKRSKKAGFKVKITGATTGSGGRFFPFSDIGETPIEKNFRILSQNYGFGTVNIPGQTKERINQGGGVKVSGIGGEGM